MMSKKLFRTSCMLLVGSDDIYMSMGYIEVIDFDVYFHCRGRNNKEYQRKVSIYTLRKAVIEYLTEGATTLTHDAENKTNVRFTYGGHGLKKGAATFSVSDEDDKEFQITADGFEFCKWLKNRLCWR